MRPYIALYRNKRVEVYAESSYKAQQAAAKIFGARKRYDVTVMLADVTHIAVD